MANVAEAGMRGFSFVDNVFRQDRADKRLETLQKRDDEAYAKQKAEEEGFHSNLVAWIKSKAEKDPSWQQVAANPAATKKMVTLAEDPLSAAKAVDQWYQVKDQLNSGKLPNGQLTLDFLNNPNVAGRDLSRRFAANKLEGALSAIYPTPDQKGLFFEATLTGPDGKQYVAPLTKGHTKNGDPGSEQDEVEAYPIGKLLDFGHGAFDGNMGALIAIAENGGVKGAEFAANFLAAKDNARRASLIKEFEYQREKSDKRAQYELERGDKEFTRKEDRQWAESDMKQKHKYAMEEKAPPGVEVFKDSEGNYLGYFDKGTKKYHGEGGGEAGSAKGFTGYVTTSDGRAFKNKEAKELFKSLPNNFLAKASTGDALMSLLSQSDGNMDSMPTDAKKSIVAAAEEVANNPKATERERSMAKLWLDIGEGLGVFPKQIAAKADGMEASHGQPAASGLDPKKFADELASIKASRQGQPQQTGSSHGQPKAPGGGIARSVGRALAGPGGPQSDSMGLETVAKGISGAAAIATPAMVEAIKDLPDSVKQGLKQRIAVEKWTVEQLAQAINEIKAGYQEGQNR